MKFKHWVVKRKGTDSYLILASKSEQNATNRTHAWMPYAVADIFSSWRNAVLACHKLKLNVDYEVKMITEINGMECVAWKEQERLQIMYESHESQLGKNKIVV
jgi:hypothetical protein